MELILPSPSNQSTSESRETENTFTKRVDGRLLSTIEKFLEQEDDDVNLHHFPSTEIDQY